MAGKRPKPSKKATKDQIIQLRASVEQKRTLQAAAERAGASLSTWIVTTCMKAAREELSE